MQFKSALVTDASGSIGGMTASRNRSGLYLRSRVVPVDPATSRQQTMRSIMASLVSEWIDITEPERQAWRDYAANVEHTPRFCGPIFLTGQNQFVRTNAVRHQNGFSTLIIAPTIFDTGQPLTQPTVVEITQVSPPNTYTVTVPFVAPADAAGQATMYMSRPFSPSRTYFRGPYQLMEVAPYINNDSEVTFTATWPSQSTEFNEPIVGQRNSFRFNALTDDGRLAHNENYSANWALDPP